MQSHTAMSTEALVATLRNLPERYDMSLNKSDMNSLLCVLQVAYELGGESAPLGEWIEQFVSDIATTVGVEHV